MGRTINDILEVARTYITDEKNAFIIYRTNGLPIAISVSDPDEFLPYYLKGGTKWRKLVVLL